MCFDKAVNQLGYRIGAMLISLIGVLIPISARLHFQCTHNIAKYEAYIIV